MHRLGTVSNNTGGLKLVSDVVKDTYGKVTKTQENTTHTRK